MELDIKEVMLLLGEKDLIIFQLNKRLEDLQRQLADKKEFPKPVTKEH